MGASALRGAVPAAADAPVDLLGLSAALDRRLGAGKDVLAEHPHLTWALFWLVFLGLAAFDLLCLAPKSSRSESITGRTAFGHCLFWFLVGFLFNGGVWALLGSQVAIVWFNGYILEYLLSMDNVFFFHVVFTAYATPPGQVYKALFLGILGAVVLRLAFYLVGAEFFRLAFVVQVFFGLVLIYSGYKTARSDEDDDDPRENRCVRVITRCLPLTEDYEENGALFVRVPATAAPPPRREALPEVAEVIGSPTEAGDAAAPPSPSEKERFRGAGMVHMSSEGARSSDGASANGRTVLKGTLLLLVVIVLQVVDVIFAVDSVTAKIAEYDSVFVNFSSSAFAMLCLRSLYFVLTRLLKYFRFLKYGVAGILVMIGIKLIISHWVYIPSTFSLAVISTAFAVSILLSAALPEKEAYTEMDAGSAARASKDPEIRPENVDIELS